MHGSRLKSVLVVDDEPEIREILREILDDYHCRVLEAPNGKEAFRISQAQAIDLLITDLVMPEQEGIETVQQFREAYPRLKIIAISGAAEPSYFCMALALGADATLHKPFVLEAVDSILGRMLPAADKHQ